MRVAVDGNLICKNKTGMGIVVYNVVKHWKSSENCVVILYVPEELDSSYKDILDKNGVIVKVLGKTNYFKWEQYLLPNAAKNDNVDIIWCPYNTSPVKSPCKVVTTINDVIYMDSPLSTAQTLYKKLGIIYRRTIVPIAAKKSKRIITISEFARKEIIRFFPNYKDKIDVVLLGTTVSRDCLCETDKQNFYNKYGIDKPYILGYGSLEYRKNTIRLIHSFERIMKQTDCDYQLVLFGFKEYEKSAEYKYVKEHDLECNVIVMGYISELEKNTLYKNSEVFVFPTLAEGFGIPVLEAYAAGTPVITSDVTSVPEVAGNAAILINPNEEDEINNAIKEVLDNREKREFMISAGKEQLGKFSWETTSKAIWKIIVDAAGDMMDEKNNI